MKSNKLDALLRRVAEGNNSAFEELYEKTKRGVYAFLRTYLHNDADTEDGMQLVYLHIKRSIHTYRAGSNASAWILQIAKNIAYTTLRKNQREIPTEEIEIVSAGYDGDSVKDMMEKVLDEEERFADLADVLDGLGVDTSNVREIYEIPEDENDYVDKLNAYMGGTFDRLCAENQSYEASRENIDKDAYDAYMADLIAEYGSLAAYWESLQK